MRLSASCEVVPFRETIFETGSGHRFPSGREFNPDARKPPNDGGFQWTDFEADGLCHQLLAECEHDAHEPCGEENEAGGFGSGGGLCNESHVAFADTAEVINADVIDTRLQRERPRAEVGVGESVVDV